MLVDSEVTFAGSDTPANMIKAIDTTMNSLKGTYGIVSATSCVGKATFMYANPDFQVWGSGV